MRSTPPYRHETAVVNCASSRTTVYSRAAQPPIIAASSTMGSSARPISWAWAVIAAITAPAITTRPRAPSPAPATRERPDEELSSPIGASTA